MSHQPDDQAAELALLLARWQEGKAALEEVLPPLMERIRRIARRMLGREQYRGLLQTTMLVQEAIMEIRDKLPDGFPVLAFASAVIRRLLIEEANKSKGERRQAIVSLHDAPQDQLSAPEVPDVDEIAALGEALHTLMKQNRDAFLVVRLHKLRGMTFAEVAEELAISESTAKRLWKTGKDLLREYLDNGA